MYEVSVQFSYPWVMHVTYLLHTHIYVQVHSIVNYCNYKIFYKYLVVLRILLFIILFVFSLGGPVSIKIWTLNPEVTTFRTVCKVFKFPDPPESWLKIVLRLWDLYTYSYFWLKRGVKDTRSLRPRAAWFYYKNPVLNSTYTYNTSP